MNQRLAVRGGMQRKEHFVQECYVPGVGVNGAWSDLRPIDGPILMEKFIRGLKRMLKRIISR